MAASGTIIVTGASSGISRATALHLSGQGFDVVGTSRSAAGFERLDVTDEVSCAALVGRVMARTGRINGLVGHAGRVMTGVKEERATDEACATFETDVLGAMRMVRPAPPAMRADRRGRILHVGSAVGRTNPVMGTHGATKRALEGSSTCPATSCATRARGPIRPCGPTPCPTPRSSWTASPWPGSTRGARTRPTMRRRSPARA